MFGFTKRHEHEWRIRRLEENDKTMLSTLNEIKLGQKTQEQVNIKLDKTLDAIQRERQIDEKNKKENDKNIRDMKMWILGFDRDYLQYDCHSFTKKYFWYLKEVITMLKGILGYSFWACFWFGKCK
ncbi:phage protein [Staphylococcus aureus]|nr:phage protein [Staphylococcus aureus]